MEASEAPPIKCTTEKTLTVLVINTQGPRNGIEEDILMETEGIRHLNDEDEEGIQASCGGYAKRTLENGRILVMRVQQKCSWTGSNTIIDSKK